MWIGIDPAPKPPHFHYVCFSFCRHNGVGSRSSTHFNIRLHCYYTKRLHVLCTQHYVQVISSGFCFRPDNCSPFQTDGQTNSLRWRLFHPLRHFKKEVCLTQVSSHTQLHTNFNLCNQTIPCWTHSSRRGCVVWTVEFSADGQTCSCTWPFPLS